MNKVEKSCISCSNLKIWNGSLGYEDKCGIKKELLEKHGEDKDFKHYGKTVNCPLWKSI
jgi:hypothetical protein